MRKSHGVSSLAATIVSQAVHDFLRAPVDSAAYRTARKFIYGTECTHLICSDCPESEEGWRATECPPGPYMAPCECLHGWDRHLFLTFDWEEHRAIVAGAAGLDPEAIQDECTRKERK
jgi:hypothetical protein